VCISIRPFHSFNLVDGIFKRWEQSTLGKGAPMELGFLELTFKKKFGLFLFPIDLPLKLL
jgi:hypothetical protein